MQPNNYMIQLPNPTASVMETLSLANSIKQSRQQEQIAQQRLESQKRLQEDFDALGDNVTASAISQMMVKHPQLSKDLERAHKALSADQTKAHVTQASQVYAALEAGNPDMAQRILEDQAVAYENSGREDEAKGLRDWGELIKFNPTVAKTSTGLFLASAMGPENFTETFTKLQSERRESELQDSKVTTAQAKAREAAVKADFAESEAVLDLQKKGWDITKLQEDVEVSKLNRKIMVLDAQTKAKNAETKQQDLSFKLQQAKEERDQKLRDRTIAMQTAHTGIDNSVATIDRVLKNPELDNVIGSMEGGKFYPSIIFGTINPFADGDKRADALADVENIQSQQFLDNLMQAKERGATFGSLTEKEGAKLENYIRSLKRQQSEGQFRENLREIQRLLLKSRTKIAEKYGLPQGIPDTPNVEVSAEEVQSLLQKYSN